MLSKDKIYNLCVQIVAEKEQEKQVLKTEIAELQKQFVDLRNESKIINVYNM